MKVTHSTPARLAAEHRIQGAALELALLSLLLIALGAAAWQTFAPVAAIFILLALLNATFLGTRLGRETLVLDRDRNEVVISSRGPLRRPTEHRLALSDVIGVRLVENPDPEERRLAARAVLDTRAGALPLTRHDQPRTNVKALVAAIEAWLALG